MGMTMLNAEIGQVIVYRALALIAAGRDYVGAANVYELIATPAAAPAALEA